MQNALSRYESLCVHMLVEARGSLTPTEVARQLSRSTFVAGIAPLVCEAILSRGRHREVSAYELARGLVRRAARDQEEADLRAAARVRVISTEYAPSASPATIEISSPSKAARMLQEYIGNRDREHVVALHLDTRNRLIGIETVAIGTLTDANVSPREFYKAAILLNSAGVIAGHNHPSGDLCPSSIDRAMYSRLREAGQILGIPLLDFLIVTRDGYWAASARGA